MPPKTGVPTARRLKAPGPLRDDQRQQAEDEGEAGHHHRAEAQARALDRGVADRLALAALLDGELDDQDAVLGGQRDEHHEADLRIDIEGEPCERDGADRAEHARR